MPVPGPAASAASSGAGLDAELGIGLTELPPPRTSSPEAAKEYALAAQSVNDGSFDTGRVHLVRALKLDPGFAAAHLALLAMPAGPSYFRPCLNQILNTRSSFHTVTGER